MLKTTFTVLFSFFTLLASAQAEFQQGKISFTNGKEIEAQILNEEWIAPPSKISYTDVNGKTTTVDAKEIESFEIYNSPFKYKQFNVTFDEALYSEEVRKISGDILLKVLLEGAASLYVYDGDEGKVLFHSNENKEIENLYYKRFQKDLSLKEVKGYQSQLNNSYGDISGLEKSINSSRYTVGSLTNLFEKINANLDGDYTVLKVNQRAGEWTFFAGAGTSLFGSANGNDTYELDKIQEQFTFGLGLEYNFPIWNGKLSALTELNYSSFKGVGNHRYTRSDDIPTNGGGAGYLYDQDYEGSRNVIELPIAFKFTARNSSVKPYVQAGVDFVYILNSEDTVEYNDSNDTPYFSNELEGPDKNLQTGYFIGVGAQVIKDLSAELRFTMYSDLFQADGQNVSAFIGLFKLRYNISKF